MTTEHPADVGSVSEEGGKAVVRTTSCTEDGSGPLFPEIFHNVESDSGPAEIESLCMSCRKNGITRLLLTKIPGFREIIVMAFECPHCAFRSSEIQSGGEIAEKGCKQVLQVKTKSDINRQVVKSDSASVIFPDLDFEIPSTTQRGVLSTVEGLLSTAADNLAADQDARKAMDADLAAKIDAFIARVRTFASGDLPFKLVLDDPAGRSYVQNPFLPHPDPQVTATYYDRTLEQNIALGLAADDAVADDSAPHPPDGESRSVAIDDKMLLKIETHGEEKEVMSFPTPCASCHADGSTNMTLIDIPYFKEVVLMSYSCEHCGLKSNEIKSGGAIAAHGTSITLKTTSSEDLSRDVLKSETAGLRIPEIDLELMPGTLGGSFTTIEGLLTQVKTQLSSNSPFVMGDSAETTAKAAIHDFIAKLDKLISGEETFTFVLDDPVSNSYLQNLYAPDPDPNMTIETYERTWHQNEDLGLNDINTENYADSEPTDDHSTVSEHPAGAAPTAEHTTEYEHLAGAAS